MTDKILESFDLEPIENDFDLKEAKPKVPDFDGVQDGIKEAAEIGEQAMRELAVVAKQSQHPRDYEALTELLKTVSQLNKDLLDIQKKQKEITGSAVSPIKSDKVITNNTMFVGTTEEALEQLRKMREINEK